MGYGSVGIGKYLKANGITMGYDSNNNDACIDSNDGSCTFDEEKEHKQKLIHRRRFIYKYGKSLFQNLKAEDGMNI